MICGKGAAERADRPGPQAAGGALERRVSLFHAGGHQHRDEGQGHSGLRQHQPNDRVVEPNLGEGHEHPHRDQDGGVTAGNSSTA